MSQKIVIKTTVTSVPQGQTEGVRYQWHWRRIGGAALVFLGVSSALAYSIINTVNADEVTPVVIKPTRQLPVDEPQTNEPVLESQPVSVSMTQESREPEPSAEPASVLVEETEPVNRQFEAEANSGEVSAALDGEQQKQFDESAQVASVALGAQIDTQHVSRAVLTTDIDNREPINVLKDIVDESEFQDKLYFFTEIHLLQDRVVSHLWFHQDQLMAEVELAIHSNRYRTYSSKNITPSQTGEWRVEVVTESGQLLAQKSFRIVDNTQ
ncbi:DUF2914 domain-containing protein [Pseudoalteromonas sp. T1lg65]|uniref:DUF2914 domain-containing protein n=1 Tax=Pseudoalteromonas sp. T1lg65 TaxID=2077101 RepID=UPI003F79E473